jgi:hypothetical protein
MSPSNGPGSSRAEVKQLEDEIARYRATAENALEQLDYCIEQFQADGRTRGIARQLRKNQKSIEQRMHMT